MIYLTGDIHGEVYRIADAASRYGISQGDTIVLLSNVGINYFGNHHGDRHRKKRINKIGATIFCIHGNHEMRPETISSYHEVPWHGGLVYVENEFPNLLLAKDGEVYDLDGQKAIVIGGAYSVDKWYRLQCNLNWFPDEQPSDEIKARVERKLEKLGWRVDIVLTHTCPEQYIPREAFLSAVDQSTVDNSTEKPDFDYPIYYTCVIADATTCCSQGLEFVLSGGHSYGNDYPELGRNITVVETFETYEEDGNQYCQLVNAVIE